MSCHEGARGSYNIRPLAFADNYRSTHAPGYKGTLQATVFHRSLVFFKLLHTKQVSQVVQSDFIPLIMEAKILSVLLAIVACTASVHAKGECGDIDVEVYIEVIMA